MLARILLTVLSILLLSACTVMSAPSSSDLGGVEHDDTQNARFKKPVPVNATPISFEARKAIAKELDERIVQSGNEFGLQLHQKLIEADQEHNVFLSPYSVTMALAMAFNGSDGETRQAIAETLGWNDMSNDEVNQANQALKHLLESPGKDVELNIANSLWSRDGYSFKQAFLNVNQQYYDAEVASLDFSDPMAADQINHWVNEQTKGKIERIIDGGINEQTMLFLINAVYFKGGWTNKFDESNTRDDQFKLLDGSTIQIPMMTQNGNFEYMQGAGFQAIRLPYGERQMNMLIIVPDEDSSLDALHEQIWSDPSRFQQSFQKLDGTIQLPRFQIEYEQSLNDALQALGMDVAFNPSKADFSGMGPIPPNLYIDNVKHKSYLEVNEEGSEAAAVTSIEVRVTSVVVEPEPFQMIVDRPFFLAIEDRQTGAWLFVGSILNPID